MNDVYVGNESKRPYFIFNWIQFDPVESITPATRMEAKSDHKKMKKIFDELDFHQFKNNSDEGFVRNACNEQFKDTISNFVEYCTQQKDRVKCICVMISSHGEERKVQVNGGDVIEHQIRTKDGFISTTRDLIKPFTDACELEDIPKIFLIQACSHNDASSNSPNNIGVDKGIQIQLVDTTQEEYTGLTPVEPVLYRRAAQDTPIQVSDGTDNTISQPSVSVVQECSDNCIVVFSSPSGYKSSGGKVREGGLLVEALGEALKTITQQEFSLTKFLLLANKLVSGQQDRSLERVPYLPLLRINHQLSMDIKLRKKQQAANSQSQSTAQS